MMFRRKGGKRPPARETSAGRRAVSYGSPRGSDPASSAGVGANVIDAPRPRRWMPAMPDLVFGLVLATVLIGGRTGLLNDPGTFWHLQLGREILGTGHVPRVDSLTYTRQGVPWVDQSWAFDVALAALVDHAGWSAAIAAAALGLAALYASLARTLIGDGNSPVVAAIVALLAVGVGANHFLIRPHLFTLL